MCRGVFFSGFTPFGFFFCIYLDVFVCFSYNFLSMKTAMHWKLQAKTIAPRSTRWIKASSYYFVPEVSPEPPLVLPLFCPMPSLSVFGVLNRNILICYCIATFFFRVRMYLLV
jgi:hypothetical protein